MKAKSKTKAYDVIVIGGGSAGFSAAEAARARGVRVALVEKGLLGGECPNWACVPTKALLKSARMYESAKGMADYGVHTGRVTYSFQEMMKRKNAVVATLTGAGERFARLFADLGIAVIEGAAVFVDKYTIQVNDTFYTAKSFVIATGAEDVLPPIEGLQTSGFLGFKDVVSLKRKPSSICIIGGGPVGCEFATFFSLLDTRVTLLQRANSLLDREDPEIAGIAAKELAQRGVQIFTDTKTLRVRRSGLKKQVTFQVGRKQRQTVRVDAVLVAVGKRANVDGLHLSAAKVKLDEKGGLLLKETLQTSAPHIFAAGDVTSGYLFTHTGHYEGFIAGTNAALRATSPRAKLERRDLRVVPRVTFVHPEVASVGFTVAQAKAEKKQVLVGSFPIGALGRALTDGDRRGLVKLVVEKGSGKILGGHIVGERAGELIHEVALAMHVGATAHDLSTLIHAYPTYSEAITAAAGDVL